MQRKRRPLEKAGGRDGGRGGGELEIYGPLKASCSAEHPARALRPRQWLDQGWDLHLAESQDTAGTKREAQVMPCLPDFSQRCGFRADNLDLPVSMKLHPPRLTWMFGVKSSHDLRFFRLSFVFFSPLMWKRLLLFDTSLLRSTAAYRCSKRGASAAPVLPSNTIIIEDI